MKIGQSAGKDYAYLLGVFLGDGCVTKNGSKLCFRLNAIDEDFVIATRDAIYRACGTVAKYHKQTVKKSRNPNYALYCSNEPFAVSLVEAASSKRVIPGFVFEWPRANKVAFVSGLMDSEGFLSEDKRVQTNRRYTMGFKSCDVWFDSFVTIVEELGIVHTGIKTLPPQFQGRKGPKLIRMNIESFDASGCRFSIKRKQDRVTRFLSSAAYSCRTKQDRAA